MPSPSRSASRVYFLHGFSIDGQNFSNFLHVPEAVAHEAARGTEFIVVVPDTLTKMGGSMYSSSVTTGDFQQFVARDLVSYIDGHYRTLAKRESRALAGHSMGGYGTWTIGMKYPQMWSSIYAMSACCVSPRTETVESAQKLVERAVRPGAQGRFRHARRPRFGRRLVARAQQAALLHRFPVQGRRGRQGSDRAMGRQFAAGDGAAICVGAEELQGDRRRRRRQGYACWATIPRSTMR
jgi:S-formylglutathione hydrolase FrmB